MNCSSWRKNEKHLVLQMMFGGWEVLVDAMLNEEDLWDENVELCECCGTVSQKCLYRRCSQRWLCAAQGGVCAFRMLQLSSRINSVNATFWWADCRASSKRASATLWAPNHACLLFSLLLLNGLVSRTTWGWSHEGGAVWSGRVEDATDTVCTIT